MNSVKLKICGVNTVEEMKQLNVSNIDYVGINFIEDSKRFVTFKTAKYILKERTNDSIKTVALFKNHPLEHVQKYASELHFDYIQLNGIEDATYIKLLPVKVFRTVYVANHMPVSSVLHDIEKVKTPYFILDRERQGEGERVKLDIARSLVDDYPNQLFLAGGIDPENITSVLSQVIPFGIDISSGVRTNNTIDILKVNECLDAIRRIG